MRKRWKEWRADVLLLGGLLLAGCVFGLALLLTRHDGAQVQVRVAGQVVETFPLAESRTYEITGANGGTNLLVIRDGEAWVGEASCPDSLCIHMGKISRNGQSVVCLPNQVVVEVVSSENTSETSSEIDLITG